MSNTDMSYESPIAKSNNKSDINCHYLDCGVTVVSDKPVIGFKFFVDCEIQQSFLERFQGVKKVYSKCYAMVTVPKKGNVVRPFSHIDDICFEEIKSDNIRSDKLIIGNIITPGGKRCVSATSPFRRMKYHPNTEYNSYLDRRLNLECVEGLHFYTSQQCMELKSGIRIGNECDHIEHTDK